MDMKVYRAFTGFYHYSITFEDGRIYKSRQYSCIEDATNALMDSMDILIQKEED